MVSHTHTPRKNRALGIDIHISDLQNLLFSNTAAIYQCSPGLRFNVT